MSLRRKTLLLIVSTAIILSLILFTIASTFLLNSFADLEKRSAHRDMERVLNVLQSRLSALDVLTKDWAAWDDTYAFIENKDEDYIRTNLTDEAFINARLNLMAYIDSSGTIVLVRAFDLDKRSVMPAPAGLSKHLTSKAVIGHTDVKSRIVGVLPLDEVPMLFASRPILTSEGKGPPKGTLIMGQYLDLPVVDSLAETALVSFTVHGFNEPQLSVEFEEVTRGLSNKAYIFIKALSDDSVVGYALLKDIYGQPYLILRAEMPRDIYSQGKATVLWFIMSIVVGSCVFIGIGWFLLEKWILARLGRLGKTVTRIAESGDASLRAPVEGSDELSALATEVNVMLTRLSQVQAALQESEKKYSTLVERSNDAIVIVQDGVLRFGNSRMAEIVHVPTAEVLGKPFIDFVSLEYRQQVIENYSNMIMGSEAPDQYEIVMLRKDGLEVPVEVSASVIEFDGKPAVLAVVRDITERKRAEEKRAELEQKAQMASRLAAVGEMSSGIAHEINNPLTGVIGYADLLIKREDLPEDIKKDLNTIHDAAQRVASIVKRLLTFARQGKPTRDYVMVNDIIKNTLAMRTYHLEKNKIKVTTCFNEALPITVGDAGLLQQVFLNLIINAETEMKLSHGRGNLIIKTEYVEGMIKISFQDDGPGISKENLSRIFEPFFTTREVGQGTGLGLSICHGIIAEHNGEIYVESELGKGATFIVTLPVVAETGQAKVAAPLIEESRQQIKTKILVVDDEAVVREFLSWVLTEQGHEVETVDNAADALEKIKDKRYGLILLDIKMPNVSGIELYKSIRSIALSLANRVVFITGDVMSEDTRIFLSTARVPFLTKPIDKKKLNSCLELMLS